MSAKRKPRSRDREPRPADKDRPIDPMSGKNSPAKEPEPVSSLWTSGRAPALHAACLLNPCLLMLPFRFAHAMRLRPLSVGRVERAFHPAIFQNTIIHNVCKQFCNKNISEQAPAIIARLSASNPIGCSSKRSLRVAAVRATVRGARETYDSLRAKTIEFL
jgi:hypothetical protein